jgi:hypothetical protein
MRVSSVLDRDFSFDRRSELGRAFWLVDSANNRQTANSLWATGEFDPNSAVFDDHPDRSLADRAADLFAMVAEHHPNWSEIGLIGLGAPSETVRRSFHDQNVQVDEIGSGRIVLRPVD